MQIFFFLLFSIFNFLVQPTTRKKCKGGKKEGNKKLSWWEEHCSQHNPDNPKAATKEGCDPFLEIKTGFHSYSRQWSGNINPRRTIPLISWDHFLGARVRFKSHPVEHPMKIRAEGDHWNNFVILFPTPFPSLLAMGKHRGRDVWPAALIS